MTEKEHWHLDKRVNITDLLTTLTVVGAMLVWAMNIESRIAEHKVRIITNATQISDSEKRTNKSINRMYRLLGKMDDKLDKINDRFIERR